jgi:hypothetical protein
MKAQHLFLLACAATVLAAYAATPATEPPIVALRFVSAAGAFNAIQQKLGAKAAEAVSRVDEKRNTVALDSAHSQSVVVRAFLAGLDHQPPEVRVEATITRRLETTASSPARDEVLSRRTFLPQGARPEVFSIPGEHGSTKIELRVTQLSK